MSGQTYDQGDGALQAAPREGMVKLANIIYLLHGISVVMGLVTSASVVGSFVFSLPSIVAVILNYLQRSEVRGTYLDSHFGWQIRTFWYAFGCIALAWLFVVTIVGIPFAMLLGAGAGVWVIYRVVRGWLALNDGRPMPV
jgi:uncharacterized membrane protein